MGERCAFLFPLEAAVNPLLVGCHCLTFTSGKDLSQMRNFLPNITDSRKRSRSLAELTKHESSDPELLESPGTVFWKALSQLEKWHFFISYKVDCSVHMAQTLLSGTIQVGRREGRASRAQDFPGVAVCL